MKEPTRRDAIQEILSVVNIIFFIWMHYAFKIYLVDEYKI